jgi:hypothetical protein
MKQLSSRTARTNSDSCGVQVMARYDEAIRHRFKRCVSSARLVLITTNEKN